MIVYREFCSNDVCVAMGLQTSSQEFTERNTFSVLHALWASKGGGNPSSDACVFG